LKAYLKFKPRETDLREEEAREFKLFVLPPYPLPFDTPFTLPTNVSAS
jgi:hypothetical protein